MSMSRIISLVEARSTLPKKDTEGTTRAFVRMIDAFSRAENKAEGTGPKAALDSVVRRASKLGDDSWSKSQGIILMLKLMYASDQLRDAATHKKLNVTRWVDGVPQWKFTAQDKEEIKRILHTLHDDTMLTKIDMFFMN